MTVSVGCHLYDVAKTTATLIVVKLNMTEPEVSCSGGVVAVGTPDDRYNKDGNSIATTLVTITGLDAWTRYTFMVDGVSGSFKTMPADQDTDFSFIFMTCDAWQHKGQRNTYGTIRALADDNLIQIFHVDDVHYVDGCRVTDNDTTIATTDAPELSKLSVDYAAGWAIYYGLVAGSGIREPGEKYSNPDRQWCYQNIAWSVSGGDHAVGHNHCRGQVGAADYFGCDRSEGGQEEVAKAEWDSFLGQANPTPLRVDKWHWGKTIGPIRFALFDYSLYAEPYEGGVSGSDLVGYGAEQISDVWNYMDVDTEPFKVFMHESPMLAYGQPWRDWHPDEADAWKAAFDGKDNVNGVSGSAFALYGDNHAMYVNSFDTLWGFSAGIIEDSSIVSATLESEGSLAKLAEWGGQNKWSNHAYTVTADRQAGGFWHFKVFASESPKRIEAKYYDGGSGAVMAGPFTLIEGATDNQWVMPRRKIGG